MSETAIDDRALRKVIAVVAALNLAYFGVEALTATVIGSVALFADSIDFLEDAGVSLLILLALGWSARARAHIGMALTILMLAPATAMIWTALRKLSAPVPPDSWALSVTGLGALCVNLASAFLLSRFRGCAESLIKAAFLSARNDAAANVAIVGAGLVTAFVWMSGWPDLVVGIGIAVMNADAARQVWKAARSEYGAVE